MRFCDDSETFVLQLVEGEEQFQQTLADTLVEESAVNMNV